jgi:hypothetical protein
MARISERNELYRTKAEIASDVAFALRTDALHLAAKRAIIDQAIWVWSEFDGKYDGCPYWSPDAIRAQKNGEQLIHEHPVPRKVIRTKLFALRKPSPDNVFRLLKKLCVGVVLSKKEDALLNKLGLRAAMPSGWNETDIWARYTEAKIKRPRKI